MDGGATVDISTLDGHAAWDASRLPQANYESRECIDTPILSRFAPCHEAHEAHGMLTIRETLRKQGVSEAGTGIILASWKPSTAKQYQTHIERWKQFCDRWDTNFLNPTASNIINFLTETFNRNVGYDTINTARAALSSLGIVIDGCRAGNHPLINRFMKGVFNLRTPTPRYTEIWDVQPVLQKLRSMYPLQDLTLRDLTLKLAMLMSLTLAARVQTLHLLVLHGMNITSDHISLQLGGNIKQCRPNFNIKWVKFQAYSKDDKLCVCKTLLEYIARTKDLRQGSKNKDGKLFISFNKPHNTVSKDTIVRWIKSMLSMSGVDTTKFKAGSVRPAATSKAKAMAVPVTCIMQKAGWSRETTFAKYYDKRIETNSDIFQDAVLG